MKKIFIIFLLCLAVSMQAQYQSVLIGSNYPDEVSICINPKNPNQMVAGANINLEYYSSDGGQTWTQSSISSTACGVWGDPIIIADTAGSFYYLHLSDPSQSFGGPGFLDRIVIQKSTDAGVTWSDGAFTEPNTDGKLQDKHGVAINPKTNEMYVCWTSFDSYGSTAPGDTSVILFSKSTDGGLTWSTPQRISIHGGDCSDSDGTVEGCVPAIGPHGEIYAVWAGPLGITFNMSTDDGVTWMPSDKVISDLPGGWDYNISGLQRCNGMPATFCDLSGGPNNGTIYVNWTDQRNGTTDTDVWLIKSSDGGSTWTAPIRVNDDAPGSQQFMSWMTVDQTTGYLYGTFYDRRNFTSGDSTDVYLAWSIDGGQTFTNVKINQQSFAPDPGVFFGDYIGISAVNNVIRPVWMEYHGVMSAWTSLVESTLLGIPKSASAARYIGLEQNYPNPVNGSPTWIKFNVSERCKVNLFLYDAMGKLVARLYDNEVFDEGSYDYILNPSSYKLAGGVYYYTLQSNETVISRKMTVF